MNLLGLHDLHSTGHHLEALIFFQEAIHCPGEIDNAALLSALLLKPD